MKKKDLGLPHYDDATEKQRRDGMCWRKEDEIYNNGVAFKLTCRDRRGVMVTIIADNYYGYCKKEVKTQISYAANLFGMCEEEHAGGAIAFPAYVLGQQFYAGRTVLTKTGEFRRSDAMAGRQRRIEAEALCHGPHVSRHLLCSGERRIQLVREGMVRMGAPTANGTASCCGRTKLMCCRGARRSGWKSRSTARRGVWWLRAPTAFCATNRAPCRAAASRRFRNPSAASF